jgi:hypothetical protein
MAHYAFLDENNKVTEVIVGRDENENGIDWEQHYSEIKGQPCKRCSYSMVGGIHKNGGTPFRKNYPGHGFQYDESRDAFIPPKEYNSWSLNEETCLWQPPIQKPNDGKKYIWNEGVTNWEEVIIIE